MKKIFTLSVSFALLSNAIIVNAQDMLKGDNKSIGVKEVPASSLKKATVPNWYDYVYAAGEFGVTWTRITNATLFPDSLVYQLYGNGAGGVQLGRTATHSVGQIFDATDENAFFDDPHFLSRFNPYTFDTLAIRYRYSYNVPGSTDTLLIQFYNNDKIQRTILTTSQRPTATVGYDKAGNKGSGATSQIRILLTAEDTSNWADNTDYRVILVPVPNGGIKVPADGLCAWTMSFIPGYEYENGDTIQQDWSTPPTKKLNHFLAPRYRDNSKLMAFYPSYNTGISANNSSRYTSDFWNNLYISGHAWYDYDECYYSFFHIIAEKVSVPEIGENVKIYPNPSVATPTLITGLHDLTSITVSDLSGKIVSEIRTSENTVELNLPAGVYVMSLECNGIMSTHRIIRY